MPDLNESVWKRGTDDAKRWLGMLRWRIAGLGVTGGAVFVGTSMGASGPLVALAAGGAFVLTMGAVGVIRAPYVLRADALKRVLELEGAADKRAALTERFRRGNALFNATITAVAYEEWKAAQAAWTRDTAEFLANQWGPPEREMFVNPGQQLPFHWERALNEQHNREILGIKARLDVIRTVLQRGA